MYLKSIEIQGFKSFANKMVFEFHDGITAIVGPNGSGKSNVADAVRWVLGEQSAKQLRGTKMEDVIFSGTELRKPQGFAYVAITLNNADHKLPTSYEEVKVARRVYRSGESEYLLNGSVCRLKDVQELFLDTGIGKEGYSIIGQGQIDKILSGKPEERRELFDEAAGIAKFKKRKSVTEKNLEIERQNLCRIKDILSELEKQVGPLEQQSAVAKEYLRLREELKNIEVNMFLLEYDEMHQNQKEIIEKTNIANDDLNLTKEKYEKTKKEYEILENQIEIANQSLEDDRNQLSEAKIRKEQLEGSIKVCNEQIIAAIQNDAHYKQRVETIQAELIKKEIESKQYSKDKEALKESIVLLNQKKEQAEIELKKITNEIAQFGKNIDSCNSEIFEALSAIANIKSKIQRFETMLEQNNVKKAEITQRILKNKSDEARFNETLEQEKIQYEQVSNKIFEMDKKVKALENSIKELNKESFELKNQQEKNQQEYHKTKSRQDSLKNITERYEGYGQSIRKVMEQKERKEGIVGVVADIIKVKKEYETAIEIALGGTIQNIVTDSEQTAKDLIEYLKKNKYGRATFLPLTAIRNKNNFYQEKVLQEDGVIGLASTLIEAEKRFDGLVEYLLGKIVVVDHINNAISLTKKYNNSLRIVTLEGELINPGGSMSGGAYKNSSNLLSRRREIEELEKQIKKLSNELKNISLKLENGKEQKGQKYQEIKQYQNQLQELFLEQNTAKLNYDRARLDKETVQIDMQQITIESTEIEKTAVELKEHISMLHKKLAQSEAANGDSESQIEAFNKELDVKKTQEANYREHLSNIILEFSTIEQKNEFILQNIKRVQTEIESSTLEYEKMQTGMIDSATQVNQKEKEIEEFKNSLLIFDGKIKEIEEKIQKEATKKNEISQKHKSIFIKRDELQNRMNELDKEVFRLSNQHEKIEEQLEQKMNYMWEEYELSYNGAYSIKIKTALELPQMKKEVQNLKGKIKALGDINVNAIEDYKIISQRYELFRTQHDDLIEAEEILKDIIEELDNEMRKQFKEKFSEIRVQFDLVFKELFGGGKGNIELVEGEDILDAGIKIIAQPPGKKLQNMMQLSGGEKALTAISLMFAIQNLKPSPFCLLDEIEAALDDSNVTRYARYLHKLTKHTQFIVITHRKGTMASADILYGITMQEKGVSTLVSVNLIEDQLEDQSQGA